METYKTIKEKQYEIFVSLMVMRMFPVKKEDLIILNFEKYFDPQKIVEKNVLLVFEKYLTFLDNNDVFREKNGNEEAELISDILKKISIVLDMDINKGHIKMGCYSLNKEKDLDDSYMTIQEEMMDIIQEKGFTL